MGLWEFLKQWQRGRLVTGILASILLHVLMTWAVLSGLTGNLQPKWVPKKGDSIIVELPKPEEPASAGHPSAQAVPPPSPPAPRSPAPRPSPAPLQERRVAAAPRPAEAPAPRVPEPSPRVPEPAPRIPDPAPRAAEPAPRQPEPTPPAVEPTTPPAPPVAEAPRAPAAPEPRREAERQVAALPPGGGPRPVPSASDVRSALRGAGGSGQSRGGIVGDPIPLDSDDARYNEFLEQVRRRIKEKWGFPCVKKGSDCQHHTTSLDVEFGILKNGRVQFVEVLRNANDPIYDDYATRAILLAQPFPPVPPVMMAAMRQGSTGALIRARFMYVVESSLTNLLH